MVHKWVVILAESLLLGGCAAATTFFAFRPEDD